MSSSLTATALSLAVSLALVTTVPAYASSRASTPMTQTRENTSSTAESVSSESERVRARVWGLSERQWQRYRQLMQGLRGSVSPERISPIEVLGIHARDEAERQRYAERWARAMHEDAERILAFQRAYDEASRRLYPGEPLIDPTRLPDDPEKPGGLQPGDRVLFFTGAECVVCDALLGRLLRRIDVIAGIDIYLSGEQRVNDEAVRDWAKGHAIKPEWVRSRRVTLNHDAGALEELTGGEGQIPTLMRRRGEVISKLRAADL